MLTLTLISILGGDWFTVQVNSSEFTLGSYQTLHDLGYTVEINS